MNTQDGALYRLLTLRPASYPGRDGTDLFREAICENSQGVRDCVKQMLGDLHAGEIDHTELGRKVWDMVSGYAQACPRYEDELAAEEMDARARRFGVGA